MNRSCWACKIPTAEASIGVSESQWVLGGSGTCCVPCSFYWCDPVGCWSFSVWLLPPCGDFKLNIHASKRMGMGVMIRESNRLVVLAASKCIPNEVQGWEAEALALLFGLKAVHRLEVPNLLVKLRSTSFIRSLHLRSIRVKRLYCAQVLLTDDYPTNSNM